MVDTSRWTLFIDEAGNFAEPKDHVLVAGVCIPARVDAGFGLALKHALQDAAPLVPWPLHRRLMNRVSSYVLWYAHRPISKLSGPIKSALSAADALFGEQAFDARARSLALLAEGKEPIWDDLGDLDRVLRGVHHANYELIQQYADEVKSAASAVMRVLVRERLKVDDDPNAQPFVVFASESVLADAHTSDDRYLVLLECLLERVWEEFDRREGKHTVDIHVASREVIDPRVPAHPDPRKHPTLSKGLVKHLSPQSPNTLMLADSVWSFDSEVEPGIVFADILNNYLYGQTKYQSLKITDIEALISNYFGITTTPGTPELPQITASGIPRDSIKSRKVLPAKPNTRVWAMEQARVWIEFYEGGDQ